MATIRAERVLPVSASGIRLRRRSDGPLTRLAPSVAHQSELQRCEIIFAASLLMAIVGETWHATTLGDVFGVVRPFVSALGLLLAGVGALLLVAVNRQFVRTGQSTAPGIATRRLITDGVFRHTRHPTYLAYACLLAGTALVFDSLWAGLLIMPYVVAVHLILIRPEERYLKQAFGLDYRLYAKRVRCWL